MTYKHFPMSLFFSEMFFITWVFNASNNSSTESSGLFNPKNLAILFIILGIVLLAIEGVTPGFFMAVPGTIFLILGILGLIIPDMYTKWYTPVIIIVVLLLASIATLKFYQSLGKPAPTITSTTLSLVGKEGIVIRTTNPDDNTIGKVRVEGEDWSATSDEPIPVGTRVVVVGGEGVHLKVKAKEGR